MTKRCWFGLIVLSALSCSKSQDSSSPAAPASGESTASAVATDPPAAPPTASAIPAPPDVAVPPADAVRSSSGLVSKVLTAGTGKEHPVPSDKVKVHYTGWTKAGQMFDSSVTRGEPITFPLNAVIPGWTEGVPLMVVGEKRRLWIPAVLAYGVRPRPGTPTGDLVFDIELLEIIPPPKAPPVPEDVKAAPANAKKTASGLAYRELTPGTGTDHPTATGSVTVNYTGWTPDGKMFDSTVAHRQPATFRLNNVIKGWTEGVALMTKGEKVRFWIPASLAYGDKPTRPGAPPGPLVFDIELIDF
jgi:FKBP-type peptidyl-prolyl cis-trans isomerase